MVDIFADEHVQAREMLERCQPEGANPSIELAANPIKFTGTPTNLYQAPPKLVPITMLLQPSLFAIPRPE